ncbi:hypothetical protein [Methylomonas sp. AM2-LC]|uniref:hypothetical protein n=1 Tax=Methylomonas sp. AM2-LC TaxID=3153301 RepID=UPI003264FCB1
MSHTIIFNQTVVKFNRLELNSVLPEANLFLGFHNDQYLLFYQAGDNNLTTTHPRHGREVVKRSWYVLAGGQKWQMMSHVVSVSADCEGGMLRLYGQKDTLPESYIRRVRNLAETPYSTDDVAKYLSFQVQIFKSEFVKVFRGDNVISADFLSRYSWSSIDNQDEQYTVLRPLISIQDAFLFFESSIQNKLQKSGRLIVVDGPFDASYAHDFFVCSSKKSA